MRTMILANHKGGVGKSAVATLVAQHWRRQGRRVLVIDFDHQGNLSQTVAVSKRAQVTRFSSDRVLTSNGGEVPDSPFVLVPADDALMGLERQPAQHNNYANNMKLFLSRMSTRFDVCVVDTNPNPDIRLIAALATGDCVLCPIQLNQEAIDGVNALLNHPRVGLYKVRGLLNPKLQLLGLLPTLVEQTPFQRSNFAALVRRYPALMIQVSATEGHIALIPKRTAIAEAQAEGQLLWEMKKTSARDTWVEIEPMLGKLTELVFGLDAPQSKQPEASHAIQS